MGVPVVPYPVRILKYLRGLYKRMRSSPPCEKPSQPSPSPVRPPSRTINAVFRARTNHRQSLPTFYPEYSRAKSSMLWSLTLVVAVAATVQGQREVCLSVEEDPYFLFGTKTAYIFANKGIPNVRTHDIPGCQPIAFWSLNRPGSHNPELEEIPQLKQLINLRDNLIGNYRAGSFRNFNERLCTSDINLLERWQWSPRHNETFAGDLTSDGYITTQQLAQAWRQRFPGLLTNNRHDYLFKYTNDKRSETTARAFTEGLFKAQADALDIARESDEKLLKPYKTCSSWKNNVEGNNDTLSQMYIFESKREYKEMITNVSQRLGFSYDISKEIMKSMYQMCRYNKAWDVAQISPWCAAFSREDLQRLEYAEDLETYYKYGYGSTINQRIGCSTIKDMMKFFTDHVEQEGPVQPRSVIHFTDVPMLFMTLTAMTTHKDSAPITGDNYHTNLAQARQWRSSVMGPFNANLAAALYKCTPNGNFQVKDKYQVLFLENEKTMYLDGCRVGLCDWSYVKNRFGEVADLCNLEACNGAVKNGVLGVYFVMVGWLVRLCLA